MAPAPGRGGSLTLLLALPGPVYLVQPWLGIDVMPRAVRARPPGHV